MEIPPNFFPSTGVKPSPEDNLICLYRGNRYCELFACYIAQRISDVHDVTNTTDVVRTILYVEKKRDSLCSQLCMNPRLVGNICQLIIVQIVSDRLSCSC